MPAPRRRDREGRGLCILRQQRANGCVLHCPCRIDYGACDVAPPEDRVRELDEVRRSVEALRRNQEQEQERQAALWGDIPPILQEPAPRPVAFSYCGDPGCIQPGCSPPE